MTPQERFNNYLKLCGLKETRQRTAILSELIAAGRHVSAEELFDIVKRKDPTVGQATVFRTVKMFVEAEIAHTILSSDKILRYEYNKTSSHHDHIVCTECGKVTEFQNSTIERLQTEVCKKIGYIMTDHRLELFGICPDCQSKQKKSGRKTK